MRKTLIKINKNNSITNFNLRTCNYNNYAFTKNFHGVFCLKFMTTKNFDNFSGFIKNLWLNS